jgi:hypothetical protein
MGHVTRLRPIIEDLLADGWRLVAVMRDVEGARRALGDLIKPERPGAFRIHGAPVLIRQGELKPRTPLYSLAEILAWAGFANRNAVKPLVEVWRKIVEHIAPDIVLVDSAPSLAAAVRGRIPIIAVGNGWAIPPAGARIPFLPLRDAQPEKATRAEDAVCAAFEGATGRVSAHGAGDFLRGDQTFVCCPTLLDPYHPWREEPLYWPPELPVDTDVSRDRVGAALAYLPGDHPAQGATIAAHQEARIPLRAWFGLAESSRTKYTEISAAAINLREALPTARYIVHRGGGATAAWALALCVPQIVLPTDLEKSVVGVALAAAGAGVTLFGQVSTGQLIEASESLETLIPAPVAVVSPDEADAEATRKAILQASRSYI